MNTPTRIEGRAKRHIIKAIFCALIACIIAFYGIPALGFATEDQDSSAQNTEQTVVSDAPSDDPAADEGQDAEASGNTGKVITQSDDEGSEVFAAASPRISVKVNLVIRDTSGSWETKTIKNTSLTSGSTTVSVSNTYKANKKVGDVVYEFTGFDPEVPSAITYEMAAEAADADNVATFTYTAQYTEHQPITVAKRVEGIRNSTGEITSQNLSSTTLSWGDGTGINKTQLESGTGVKAGNSSKADFTYMGYRYHYSGNWIPKNDFTRSFDLANRPMIMYKALESTDTRIYVTEDVEIVYEPEYTKTMIQGLDYNYVDNISTGSGSWSNSSAMEYRSEFGSLTHTYKNPEDASPTLTPHYKFQYWQLDEYIQNGERVSGKEGKQYSAGDSFTYSVDSGLPEGSVTEVNVYAYWQPSVTVNYHDYRGNLFPEGEVEKFESIDVYASAPAHDVEGAKFLGWYDEDGNRLDEGFAYELPAITKEQVDRTEYNVYARYSTSYTVEHSLQDLDDPNSYTLTDTDTIVDVILGSEVFADPNTYTGFTFNPEIEGTVQSATVEAGTTVLKLFYERNTYTVTYEYTGDVPSNASALPAQQTYRYGEKVTIAPDATAEGYTFSGWSEKSAFDMPAENVVITGSFTPVEEEPATDSDSDKSAMPATGDTMPIALLAIVLVAAAVAFVSKRKGMLN